MLARQVLSLLEVSGLEIVVILKQLLILFLVLLRGQRNRECAHVWVRQALIFVI